MKKIITALSTILILVLALCACTCTNTTPDKQEIVTPTPTPVETSEPLLWELSIDTLVGPNGFKANVTYYVDVIDYNNERCILFDSSDRSFWIADASTHKITRISNEQAVVDYTVAYDTLYWFTLDKDVWASHWESEDFTAQLFCEDAIAVSPFTDEAEGAVVTPERSNWTGYGLPIYSPYGVNRNSGQR